MRILYIDCDSFRRESIGCYGYHRNTTPNIDQLAAEGRQFTNYYVSDAPCLPSRTALFTGRFGIHNGVLNHGGLNADARPIGEPRQFRNDGQFRTFTTELRNCGYSTTMISPFPQRHSAWHVLDGFEEWYDTGHNGHDRADHVYPYVEEWLNENAADDDWFLHVNFWDPHQPLDTPLEYGNPFEDEPAPDWPPEGTIRDHYNSHGPISAHDINMWGTQDDLPRTPNEIADRSDFKKWIDAYDTGVHYMDYHIGKILNKLKTAGVYDETFIILSADHGEAQGELNVYGDHKLADEATCHVAFIVRGPDVEEGVDTGFHYQIDLAPTIIDLVGGDIPERWDGRSFIDSIIEGADTGRDSLVMSQGAWTCQRSIRWDQWLLIRTYHDAYKPELEETMLFDISTDPHETTNLVDKHPDIVNEGLAKLQRWYDDRMLESASGTNGGNPHTPHGVRDPMWNVMREGGPYHSGATRTGAETVDLKSYIQRLRDTGREEYADELAAEYL